MQPGSVARFVSRFELDGSRGLMQLVPDDEGAGHALCAAGICGSDGRGLVLVADAVAIGGRSGGLAAGQALPYLLDVWPPVLQVLMGVPADLTQWVLVDGSGRPTLFRRDATAGTRWSAPTAPTVSGALADALCSIDPLLAPMLMGVLEETVGESLSSGPWPALAGGPLKLERLGADWPT